ncbi:bromodomain-containing protein 4B-like [Venturia canescens]|uniref:bromodomain-containing protein 4B-like n=1 Tax=Venturia canescens TaxID=32260 RepID=UPI001C9D0880|nr:bromodomain-containing protein 4B-like [Venturia canescens]
MKFVILSVVCLVGAVVAAPSPKQKRDILPGDPRYGTEHHHHHHDSHGANGVQSVYGPPNYTPAQPIHYQESVQQPSNQYIAAPVTSFQPTEVVESVENVYLAPVATQQPQEHRAAGPHNYYLAPDASSEQPSNRYLGPAIQGAATVRDSYGHPVLSQEHVHVQAQAPQQEHVHVQAQAPQQEHAHVQAAGPVQQVVHHVPAAQPAPVRQHYEAPAQSHYHVHQTYGVPQVRQHVQAVHQAVQPAAVQHPIVYQSEPQHYYSNAVENSGSSSTHHAQADYVAPKPQSYQVQIVKAQPVHYHSQVEHVQPQQHYESHHESVRVESASSHEATQLVGSNGGYVY